jgi:hypothetical protein
VDRQRWPPGVGRQQQVSAQFNCRGHNQRIRQPQFRSVLGPQPRRGCSDLPSGWLNSSRKSCGKLIDLCDRVHTLPERADEYTRLAVGEELTSFAVADCGAEFARLRSAGVVFTQAPVDWDRL